MGHIKPEDRTALAGSAGAIIAGFVALGGGIAALHYADEANERARHSGDIAYAGGVTAIIGGITTALSGAVALALKLHEVYLRDDPPAGTTTHQQLADLIAKVEALGRHLNVDLQVIQQQQQQGAPPNNAPAPV